MVIQPYALKARRDKLVEALIEDNYVDYGVLGCVVASRLLVGVEELASGGNVFIGGFCFACQLTGQADNTKLC